MVYNDEMKQRLEKIVVEGKDRVSKTLIDIGNEFNIREDFLAKPDHFWFDVNEGNVNVRIGNGKNPTEDKKLGLTSFARGQVFNKTQIPVTYADRLMVLGEQGLLNRNLNTMKDRVLGDGVLMRKVGNNIKGFLSPSYRRMDASPIFEEFTKRSMAKGFVPYRGMNTEYRYHISFIKPELMEVAPKEFVVYGLSLTSGDYGSQALQIEMMVLRVVCTNLAIGCDLLRKIHLGKRFDFEGDGNMISLSSKTYALDTKTVASAIADVVDQSETHIALLNRGIKENINEQPNLPAVLANIRKGFGKDIAEKVKLTYETPTSIEFLPQQKSTWRLANTLSLIAQGVDNSDKRIDMEKASFDMLGWQKN